jgi:ABC-2 type transport system ATP-binding protein
LTVLQNLKVYADLYGVRNIRARLDDLSGQLDISDLLKRPFGQLSSGQKTRVAVAKALINEPDLLLLDEPTASLDPDVAERVRSCLISYRKQKGAAILVASHNMQEVERICDRMVILKQGRKIAEGTPASIVSEYRSKDLESVFIEIARGREIR